MKWYSTFFRKNPERNLKNINKKLHKNVYKTRTVKEHYEKFNLFHYVFKYKILVPAILLCKKILGKAMVTKVDNKSHNKNFKIFDKAYEEAIMKWHLLHLRNKGPIQNRKTRRQTVIAAKKNSATLYLRTLKEIILTGGHWDTAYREFFNILMHEIAHKMVKEYARSGKYPNKTTNHLFFTTDIYDVNYYVLEKELRYSVQTHAIPAEQLLNIKKEDIKNERKKKSKQNK